MSVYYFSIDRDINKGRNEVLTLGIPKSKSFFLIGNINNSFVQQHKIDAIPRYMLYANDRLINDSLEFDSIQKNIIEAVELLNQNEPRR